MILTGVILRVSERLDRTCHGVRGENRSLDDVESRQRRQGMGPLFDDGLVIRGNCDAPRRLAIDLVDSESVKEGRRRTFVSH